MLSYIFGEIKSNIVHIHSHDRAAGYLEFSRARVRWFLAINDELIPEKIKNNGFRTYRSLKIEGEEFEFSGGFTELHNKVYENILSGNGFGLDDARQSIVITQQIRDSKPIGLKGDYHPFAKKQMSKHPFKFR